MVGLAALEGCQGEGVCPDTGDGLFSAEIGQPLPGEQAFDRDDELLTVGRHGLEARCRSGVQRAVQPELPVLRQETAIHGAGVQVDPAGKLLWGGVEAPEVSSVRGSP
jgi:hypothetical protein